MNNNVTNTSNLSILKKLILGFQHTLAMFGATILVPILTGLNPSVALFTAGLGTLIFHLITKKKVPVFLGSSFAFIPAIQLISKTYGQEYALGGIVCAGLVHISLATLVYFIGVERIKKIFPPVIIGPIVIIIGLGLSPTAIKMASTNWIVALSVVGTIVAISLYTKGFIKLIPILFGIIVGYIVALMYGIIDFSTIQHINLFSIPKFVFPKFNIHAILSIAPIALVTMTEHIGDITTNGSIVGEDFIVNPGLHRTLLGDGVASVVAGFLGGPASTTYAENTGVLATTKIYNPSILRIGACFSIAMSFIGVFGAILQTIPQAVLGGASMILFGMIATVGLKNIQKVDINNSRNLLIMSIILVIGLGGMSFNLLGIEFSSLSIASFVGIIINLLIPDKNVI